MISEQPRKWRWIFDLKDCPNSLGLVVVQKWLISFLWRQQCLAWLVLDWCEEILLALAEPFVYPLQSECIHQLKCKFTLPGPFMSSLLVSLASLWKT